MGKYTFFIIYHMIVLPLMKIHIQEAEDHRIGNLHFGEYLKRAKALLKTRSLSLSLALSRSLSLFLALSLSLPSPDSSIKHLRRRVTCHLNRNDLVEIGLLRVGGRQKQM